MSQARTRTITYREGVREALAEVDAAVRFAEAGTWEPVEDLLRDVVAAS